MMALFGTYYWKNNQYADSYRENYEPDKENEKYLESESSSKSKGNFQYGNLEASYEIDTVSYTHLYKATKLLKKM